MSQRRQKRAIEFAKLTSCALLTLVSFCWGADKPAKKFHSGASHPHAALTKTGEVAHARSKAPAPLPSPSRNANQMELTRLEHQNTALMKSQSAARNNKTSGPAAHVHSQAATHSPGINFSYHPPRGPSAATSGGHKR